MFPTQPAGMARGEAVGPGSDGCRREGYRPTHLVSGMLYRLRMVARRNPTDVAPGDLQSNGLSDQSTDGMNSAMVG